MNFYRRATGYAPIPGDKAVPATAGSRPLRHVLSPVILALTFVLGAIIGASVMRFGSSHMVSHQEHTGLVPGAALCWV